MLDRRRRRQGFALVVVLVILSLLTVIAVGYLSSMSSERATANAFSNKTRAEEMAQAGVDSAVGTLRDYFKAFPDSATAWDTAQSKNTDGTANEGTTLYLRAVPQTNNANLPDPAPGLSDPNYSHADFTGGNGPNNVDPGTGVDNRKIFALPLISGATVKPLAQKATALPTPTATNSINLNARRQIGDTQGWIGTAPASIYSNPTGLPKPINVPWVEITQKDPISGSTIAPVVGRYAFWVEDESFRANINYADQGQLAAHSRRDNNANVTLNSSDVSLLGLLTYLGDSNATVTRQNLLNTRAIYPSLLFPEPHAFSHADGLTTDTMNSLRYLSTSQSAAFNLTRHGTQRLNLNAVMSQSPLPTDTGATAIMQNQFDKVVQTIHFHAPTFGQRFYRTTASVASSDLNASYVTADYAKIYLAKVAANIRDYIDTDSFPTCVMPADGTNLNGKVLGPGAPTLPIGDASGGPPWALGKDAMPFMQECAVRYRGSVDGAVPSQTYTLYTDYYVEVWNMSNKDVKVGDLGPSAFIRISNPTKWWGARTDNLLLQVPLTATGTVSPTDTRPPLTSPPQMGHRDFDIDISKAAFSDGDAHVIFPAGVCTVVTTDPDYKDVITDKEALNHVVQCNFKSGGTRIYTGPMPKVSADGVTPVVYCNIISMEFDNGTVTATGSGGSDFETDTILGSDYGLIDSLDGALTQSWGAVVDFNNTSKSVPPKLLGGYLRGNWTNTSTASSEGKQASALGDPRTNNEQLKYDPSSSSSSEKTRFTNYDVLNGNKADPGLTGTGIYPTLGLPNYRSVRPNRLENPWSDYPPLFDSDPTVYPPVAADLVMNAARAPAVIANTALTSIAQLGDVFDPARIIYNSGSITSSRGGGRSLKIGQHDDRWDGDQTSASRGWAAWRLADFFCVADSVSQPGLIGSDGITQPGLFNINGVSRDQGAALRSALSSFRFQPTTSPGNPGDPLLADSTDPNQPSKLQVDALVKQIVARLTAAPTVNGVVNTGPSQTGAGPFWERGELSELPLFGRTPDTTPANTYPTTDLSGLDMSKSVFNRGRDELVRRLMEMTTTRGSVFTVYAVGQAIQPNPSDPTTRRVTGTHQLKVTFRLVPKNAADPVTHLGTNFQPGTDVATGKSLDGATSFNPNDAAQLNARFAKPDHYDVEILYESSGNN